MAGPKQHYIPAAYLGGFSDAPASPLRNSMLWVGRRGTPPFRNKASNLAFETHIYTLGEPATIGGGGSPQELAFIDEMWTRVENRLPAAIDSLIQSGVQPLDADTWMTLVAFTAQVFVRGADWRPRFVQRLIERLGDPNPIGSDKDNVNLARLFEMQRIYAPMMAARWEVLHCPPGSPIATNDLARIPMQHADGRQGYTIPLRADAALALTTDESGPLVCWNHDERQWQIDGLRHVDLTPGDVDGLNRSLRAGALQEVYGGARHLVIGGGGDAPRAAEEDPLLDPILLIPSPEWLRARELTLFQMHTIISKPPRSAADDQPWTVRASVLPEI